MNTPMAGADVPLDVRTQRASRLQALLDLGGTLENQGTSLHVRGLRMDVKWIAEMNEAVWRITLQWIAQGMRGPRSAPQNTGRDEGRG